MTDTQNPLLAKLELPGKRFRLPSRGYFYNDGELDENVVDGEVTVNSMTTVDEITLRSPEFLFSGEAIERVFKRCIPEVKKPLKLLSKDVDFLLACLRVVSYGGVYQIETRCPECEEKQVAYNERTLAEYMAEVEASATDDAGVFQPKVYDELMGDSAVSSRIKAINTRSSQKYTYDINLQGIVNNNTTEIDEEEAAKYTVNLSNGQEVLMTPVKMDSSVAALQFQNEKRDLNLDLVEEFVTFMMACSVISVDGTTDRGNIEEWCKKLRTELKKELDDATKNLKDWGPDFTYTVTCQADDCDHSRNISTLLNPITFFMTPSESEEPNS